MLKIPLVPCPRCERKLTEFGPRQKEAGSCAIIRIKMKCEHCRPLGTIWEVTLENGITMKIEFLRSLFRDFDHR